MSDTSYPVFMHYGTAAQRGAFTPSPGGGQPLYGWYETDTTALYVFDTTWHLVTTGAGAPANADFLVETANASLSAEVVTGTTYMTTATYASRQAAAKSGRIFLPSNGFYFERDSGSAWAPWGPIFPFTAPISGDFAWINQGGASVTTTNGGIFLRVPVNSGDSLRIRKKAAPSTPYTITAAFLAPLINLNFQAAGLCFRQSSDGKLHCFYLGSNTNAGTAATGSTIQSAKFSSPTAFSATYQDRGFQRNGGVAWLRIADDGANRICSFSGDGQNWMVYHSVGRTDFLTADEVGFFANDATNAYEVGMTLLSWAQA